MSALISSLFALPYEKEISNCTSSESNPNGVINYAQLLDIADALKSGKWNSKQFVNGIVKKLQQELNGNVILNTFFLIDTCVKNAGSGFLTQLSCREVIDELNRATENHDAQVRQKAKEFIQNWALLLKGNSEYFMLVDLYENLKRLGVEFPVVSAPIATAFVETKLAPPWSDSEGCVRCRTQFTTFNRKHHCRNCGMVFCQDCSSKTIALPALGLTEAVRVCEACHYKISSTSSARQNSSSGTLPPPFTGGNPLKEDEDLQRAIAASLKISDPKPYESTPVKRAPVASSVDEGTFPTIYLKEFERAIQESLKESEKVVERQRPSFNSRYDSESRPRSQSPEPVIAPQRQTSDLTETQLSNIALFSSLVEAQAYEISQKGYSNFNPGPISILFSQVSSLHPQLTASVQGCAEKYKELYDMNTELQEVVHMYDTHLQQRLQYSSRGASGLGQYQQQYQPTHQPTHQQPYQTLDSQPSSNSYQQAPAAYAPFSGQSPPVQAQSQGYAVQQQAQGQYQSFPAQSTPQGQQYQAQPSYPQYPPQQHQQYQQDPSQPPPNTQPHVHVPEAPQDAPLIEF